MKKKIIEPKISDDGLIFFDSSGLNITVFNLTVDDFLNIHSNLTKKGYRPRLGNAKINITFELYCNELINLGFDISVLINELNNAHKGDYFTLSHGLSLTKICYHYVKNGNDVKILRTSRENKSADIKINNVLCELKVRHDKRDNSGTLHEHLISALENRAQTAFEHADCLFIDLSSHFHTWNYHRIKTYLNEKKIYNISNRPIDPVKDYCILFSPDNALDRNNPEFIPKAYWGYIKWDPILRKLG